MGSRMCVAAVVGGALLLGATAASARRSAQATAPACRTTQLRITLTRTGAVTGVEGGYLRFLNRGVSECRISGWPRARAVEATGSTVTAHDALNGTMLGGWSYRPPVPSLTLQPGASAWAVIEDGDNPVRDPSKLCPTARRLRVAPPGDSHAVTLSAWLRNDLTYLPLCTAANGRPELEVSAVVPLAVLARAR